MLKHIWRWLFGGYTCDDCKRWTPRRRGRAHVQTEKRNVPSVPLPTEPVTAVAEGFDPKMDTRVNGIITAIKSGRTYPHRFTILRCPECASAWAMKRIAKAAKNAAWNLGVLADAMKTLREQMEVTRAAA